MTQPQNPYQQNPQPQSPYQASPYEQSPYQANPYQSAQGQIPYPGQQPGYGQPTFQSPAPTKRGGKGGMITFFIGLGILVLAVVFIVVSVVMISKVAIPLANDATTFTSTTTVSGGSTSGEVAMIMATDPTSPSCKVTDPTGAPVSLDTSNNSNAASGGSSAIGGFQPTMSGDYTVTCTGAREFSIMKMDVMKFVVPGLLMVAGLLMLPLGFILGLIGLILWLTGRRKFVQA